MEVVDCKGCLGHDAIGYWYMWGDRVSYSTLWTHKGKFRRTTAPSEENPRTTDLTEEEMAAAIDCLECPRLEKPVGGAE